MPGRKEPPVTGKTYHVFNKSIGSEAILSREYNLELLKKLFYYYRSSSNPGSYSKFRRLRHDQRRRILETLSSEKMFIVDILAYCFMPNHFHILLKQNVDNGISKFMSNTINAFTKHTNLKYKRQGPIFIPRFRAIPIRREAQFIHVSRYIHLNPYSSERSMKLTELKHYPWSSLKEYLLGSDNNGTLSQPGAILSLFDNDTKRYERFVMDRADYQRTLEEIKHVEKL